MKHASLEVRRYDVELLRPMRTESATATRRCGFHVIARDEAGNVGLGEAAPLERTDGDEVEAVGRALERVARTAAGARVEMNGTLGADAVRTLLASVGAADAPAAARCALETALLDLAAHRDGVSLAARLGARNLGPIAVNGLVVEQSLAEVRRKSRELAAAGFRTIKIKVGALDLAHDVRRVETVCAAVAGRRPVRLRLDANRAWTFDEARELLYAVRGRDIDYVEEPLVSAEPEALARLRAATHVALAVDESIGDAADVARFASACDVVVVKPMRVGGPSAALAVACEARANGLRVVVTDSLETRVGRLAVAHTGAACVAAGEAIGLAGAFLLAPRRPGERVSPTITIEGPGLGVGLGALP